MTVVGGSWVRSFVAALVGWSVVGCGGDDPAAPTGPECGTAAKPELFVITDVEPAVGDSVSNAMIGHTFTISDGRYVDTLTPVLAAGHTAGDVTPELTWGVLLEWWGTTYESSVGTWATAPGHVELGFEGSYPDLDGCVYAFPNPIFSYDITMP